MSMSSYMNCNALEEDGGALDSEAAAWDPREFFTPYVQPASSHIITQLETKLSPLPVADKDRKLKELKHSAVNPLIKILLNLLKLRIGRGFFPYSYQKHYFPITNLSLFIVERHETYESAWVGLQRDCQEKGWAGEMVL